MIFDLDIGQTCHVPAASRDVTVKLIDVKHQWQSDDWTADNPRRRSLRGARVTVEIGGRRHVLDARPFQMPVEVGGLRLSVEATREGAQSGIRLLDDVRRDVRFAAAPAGREWNPAGLVFPIRRFRWHASTYHNTWSALVPYNRLYYHRGEDFGAVPDILDVVAPLEGEVITSPLPEGDGNSNGLVIRGDTGLSVRLAHMNIETIDPRLVPGARVRQGQIVGRTGCTWAGRRSQDRDPHLHVGFELDGQAINPYPSLIEAYLRDYDDPAIAQAGGFHFARPGQTVELDGSRSVARPGRRIASMTWHLHDGRTVEGAAARITCDRPGLYSEQLTIRTDDGREDRDFAQVRVFDPERGRQMATGWIYHTPVRGIGPGDPVLLWNRLGGVQGDTMIDFGDGGEPQRIEREAVHRYERPGLYTVTASARGPGDEPVTVRMRVVVEG